MRSPKLGTRGVAESPEHVLQFDFDNDLFMARTTALGCSTDDERARLVGIGRSSLDRLRKGDIRISLPRAKALCRVLDVELDQLFRERPARRVRKAA